MSDTVVDLRYLAESQPSLCIPRVFNNINESRIRNVFNELGLGNIHHIDVIERKNEKGEPFKRVYIHFDKWFWNEDAQAVRRKLITGKEIKIVYDNPWFWKVSANKWTPPNDRRVEGPRQISRPHIDFEEHPPRRDREIDDFGRSNGLRNENDNRRRDDSRECKRPTEEKKAPIHLKKKTTAHVFALKKPVELKEEEEEEEVPTGCDPNISEICSELYSDL